MGGGADMIERGDATPSLLRVLGPCQVERDQQPRGPHRDSTFYHHETCPVEAKKEPVACKGTARAM